MMSSVRDGAILREYNPALRSASFDRALVTK